MIYRAYLTLQSPRPLASEQWTELHRALDRRHDELGPVMRFGDEPAARAEVILAVEAGDPASALQGAVDSLADALRAADLAETYPVSVDLEEVEEELVPA